MPLTSPAIDGLTLEKSINDLWYEFLNGWFDGASHAVGAHAATIFPDCEVNFQQSPLTQNQSKPEITITWLSGRALRSQWGAGLDKVVEDSMQWILWVRASGSSRRTDCRRVSDLLYALLSNPAATRDFGEKGIRGFRVSTPKLVPGSQDKEALTYDMRQLSVSARIQFNRGIA